MVVMNAKIFGTFFLGFILGGTARAASEPACQGDAVATVYHGTYRANFQGSAQHLRIEANRLVMLLVDDNGDVSDGAEVTPVWTCQRDGVSFLVAATDDSYTSILIGEIENGFRAYGIIEDFSHIGDQIDEVMNNVDDDVDFIRQ